MATKGCSKLYTVFDLWSGLEDIHEQVNQQNIRFFKLLQLESSDILSPLVVLLLKYYDCASSTFIFNGHSFAITLEDILYITGLPIRGIPIMDASKDKKGFSSFFDMEITKYTCPISALKDRAKDTRVDPITRMKTALLVLIACFVIPSSGTKHIKGDFVKYVDRLDKVDDYAWGAALLAFLHQGIIKWKKGGNQKSLINGNLWIVLAVFLIRIQKLSLAIGIELDLENAEVPLLHSIVKVAKPISRNHQVKYIDKVKEILDTLSEDDIRWVPYKHYQLPGILKDQEKYKLLLSPICCMDSVVHHRPHLAPRQFEELEHLDLSKLTWQETDPQIFFVTELAQWNDGKLVTDFLPGYEEEGPSRHHEETSISRDVGALGYENPNYSDTREMPLDTSIQTIQSPRHCYEGLMSDPSETSISSDAAFAIENAHHSESRENCANCSELGENGSRKSTRGNPINPPQKLSPLMKANGLHTWFKKKRMGIVCLTCGNEGFPEIIAFCNKCEAYGLHRLIDKAMATKGCSKLYTVFDLWSSLEDIHEQVNQQNIRLFRLLQVESSDILSPLVVLLLKYYDCDSSTFIFNGHSFAVTLEDILYITGLPIRGIPIMDDSNEINAFSSIAYFPISKLKDRAKDTSVDPITRTKAALLVLIACFVIPSNKSDINGDFIKYVDRLESVDNYAWGAALLAFLHEGIVKWKTAEDKKSLISGNLWIVLVVFLINIQKLSQAIGIELDLENAKVPLLHSIVKVVKPISHNHNVKYINKVKKILDTLSEDDIKWVPYKQYELPGILKYQEKYKLLLSPICCMDSIVHHRPHLAPRQFEELEHLDLSKLTWQETDLQNFSVTELAQWNDGKLVTDFLPGYEEEGLSRHNEETSISRDAVALEYENPSHSESREIPLDTSMQIIQSLPNCYEELMSDSSQTSISSAAAFGYENAHHSESRENGTNHSELDKNGANHSKLDENGANHSELSDNGARKSTRGMLNNLPQKFNPLGKPNKKKRKGIVCVTCGDIGFTEAIVLCNKCEACGLHRYCLEGPVILKDDVTWFCEDCEPKAIEPCSHDQPTLLSSKTTDSVTFANNAIQTKTNLKNCIDRLKKSKLQLQNCSEKADVVKLLTQHDHGASNLLSNSGSYGSDAYA